MDCAVCGRSYPATYFRRHKCKGKPKLRKKFTCTNCNVICSFKSNIIRHYKEIHGLDKEEIPLSVMRIKREQKPLIPCPTCGKGVTQLSNHKCKVKVRKVKPQVSVQTKPVTVSLKRLTEAQISKFQKSTLTSTGRITRSKTAATGSKIKIPIQLLPSPLVEIPKQAPKAAESLDQPTKKASKRSVWEDSSSSESSTSASENEASVEDEDEEEEDSDSDQSQISNDSIAKPKKPKIVQKPVAKLPPRLSTWRCPADIPNVIKEHIRKVYSKFTFSSLLDHQVRMRLADGTFNFRIYEVLVNNSVGRCGVDAINLIKLVYNEQRARPIYQSPVRE